jgi:hypothetical protein
MGEPASVMLGPERQAELDQATKFKLVLDTLSLLLKGMYEGLVREGFKENEAFDLVKSYVHGMGSGRLQ